MSGKREILARRAGNVLVLLFAFFLPLSTSVLSAAALLLMFCWLVGGNVLQSLGESFRNRIVLAVFAYLAVLALSLTWSPDIGAGIEALKDRWKLLLLPVLVSVIRREQRRAVVYTFLGGMGVAMLLTYLAWFDLLHYSDVSPTHLTRKTFHVVYNPLLAFAIYLVLHEAVWGTESLFRRIAWLGLALLMTFDMFITEGRTGQLVFFILLGLFLLQFFARKQIRALVAVSLFLPLLFTGAYHLSPVFRNRVDTAVSEVKNFRNNPDTSVGMRLLFWQNSWQIIKAHPLLGTGIGGFEKEYARVNTQNSPDSLVTDNPHNQYVFVLTVTGLLGFVIFCSIFMVMFSEALRRRDRWRRVRVAFPVFFLVIMFTESYLKVYETGFFFVLFSGVLFGNSGGNGRRIDSAPGQIKKKSFWLILSYRVNVPGSACSQHIDDRLPHFRKQGIVPVVLSGPIGERDDRWPHVQTHSIAPSGIRFELRHALRRRFPVRWQFKLVETILMLPVYPLYLLEKIIINLESEWSWCFLAGLRGSWLCHRYQPEVIYSTGGSASAHVAAMFIKRCYPGIRWIAETQDPLVHDRDWQRSQRVLRLYKRLELRICRQADEFFFLVEKALEHARNRTGGTCRGHVLYPGADPALIPEVTYRRGDKCRFAHFGSLAGTRNLVVFFQGMARLLEKRPELRSRLQVDVFGSFDGDSRREMKRLALDELVVAHGMVSREKALEKMRQMDCLLLIQNLIYFSCETIPSKVYEYLLCQRPVIGLVHNNSELEQMLRTNGHLVAEASDPVQVCQAIGEIVQAWEDDKLDDRSPTRVWTIAEAVATLVRIGGHGKEKQA